MMHSVIAYGTDLQACGERRMHGSGRSCKKLANFFICSLSELVVPLANRVERFGCRGANDFVDFSGDFGTGLGSRRRHCDYNPRGSMLPQRGDGCAHCRSGGETVVYEDYRFVSDINGRPLASIQFFTPFDFFLLPPAGSLNGFGIDAKLIDNIALDMPNISARNCAHREFLVAGNAELSDDEDVDRKTQLL